MEKGKMKGRAQEAKLEFEKLKLGEHLCCIYKDKKEKLAMVISFMLVGLDNNKCVYIVDESTKSDITTAFKKTGIDINKYIKKGQFQFLTKEEAYLKNGYFDPDKMIKLLKQAEKEALKAGYDGLRVTGEMTWVFTKLPGVERLVEYEAKLNYFFPKSKCTALCQYNEKKFKPEILLDVIHTHPRVAIYDVICKNTYYLPPDIFLARMKGGVPLGLYEKVRDDIIKRAHLEEGKKRALAALEQREEYFRLITENSSDIVVIVDKKATIKYISKSIEQYLGYKPEELIGKNGFKFISPLDLARAIIEYKKALKTKGISVPNAFRVKHKDGSERIFEGFGKNLLDNPVIAGFVMNVRAITERKKAEEALKAERQRLHDVLEAMPIMVCLLTPDYHVPFANRAFREKFGESHGRRCYEYCFGKKEPCDFCETYTVLKTGKPHHWQVTTLDGASVIDVYDFPFTDVDGSPMILEMDIDITDHKKIEEELKEKIRALQDFKDAAVGRELQMIELKKEINRLSRELGKPKPYDVEFGS